MSEETNEELESLRLICDNREISWHHKNSVTTLKELIAEQDAKIEAAKGPSIARMSDKTKSDRIKEAARLIRCRVTCMDPSRREWKGEIFSAGNLHVGTFKKYIPFDGEPYHIPYIIFLLMKQKKFRQSQEKKRPDGTKVRTNRFVPSFAIEVLDNLTEEELRALADDQKKRAAISND